MSQYRVEPIILAHGISRFDGILSPFYRILNRFTDRYDLIFDRFHYFKGIASHLRRNGFPTYHSSVSFAENLITRSRELKDEVNRVLAKDENYTKVHIIGHSMGGLDARRMIALEGMEDKVASLTTIGTPHNGSYFAEWALEHQDLKELEPLFKIIKIDGFMDLTPKACNTLNQQIESIEADNAVIYRAYGASQELEDIFFPIRFSGNIIDHEEGPNDGMVALSSQLWKPHLTGKNATKNITQHLVPFPADHINQVGWWDINELSGSVMNRLKQLYNRKQFEKQVKRCYLKMAQQATTPQEKI